jgi:flagellin-like hook-associated protein FlgL
MSGIVLSASVRQNLVSLQSTASLLATTQNDLATGNKVNSALDNPTNFFTAQGLNNRASDIGNLLDSIGNGVQVLQAANTGITSLQSLVSSAQSIANQVLQTPVGYSTKSSVTSAAITAGSTAATANNLLGAGTTASTAVTGSAETATAPTVTATLSTKLSALGITSDQVIGFSTGTVNFASTTGTHVIGGTSNTSIDLSTATIQDFINAANLADNGRETWALNGSGQLTVSAPGGATGRVNNGGSSGTALTALGLSPENWSANTTFGTLTTGGTGPVTASSTLTSLGSAITTGDTLTVNGKNITFVNTGAGNSITANGATIDLASATVGDVLSAIDTIDGTSTASTVSGGEITLNTGTQSDLTIGGSALAKLGLSSGTIQRTGLTLTIGATGGGTATNITFGTGAGQVSTLNALNTALAANNLQATISTTGAINIVTSNDAASSTIGTIGGTAVTNTNAAFSTVGTAAPPVVDSDSQATRSSLVAQYNEVLDQINTTAQDSSFNGVNLLNGDTLKLVFNETGTSTLSITGVTFNDAGLGLSTLKSGTDFLDNNSANTVLSQLQNASTTLRSEASALGSNLSIVQIRQDFNKNLINVLQTGASNLTLADPNQEAANSQALSTRQSIAVSALALANQSQQSVLQLLR